MRHVRVTAIGVLTVVGLAGCSGMHDRRWGACAVGGGVVGSLIGAGTAGGLVAGYEGGHGGSHEEIGGAAGGGAIAGALLGALLGHALCDPEEAAPPPPPPPLAPPPAPAPQRKLQLSADTYFDFDKAVLKPEGEHRIDEFVRSVKDDPKVHILVEGHTDSVGSDAYNQRLSERRANAVKTYLMSRGIDARRVETRGYGESKPIASNATAEGRAQNRRVEITIE